MRIGFGLSVLAGLFWLQGAPAAPAVAPVDGDYVAHDFTFASGEKLAEVRLHYVTLGTPARDAAGHVTNAILLLHGTGGEGRSFLRPQFADLLFAPGGALDPAKYYVIMPDAIGHGKSAKPSDGLHARFPSYDYDDMMAAQYRLLTEGLKVDHVRLVFGTSMGCMNGFVWGEAHPGFMDGLMPMACLPVPLAGRNRLWRQMLMTAIKSDPEWQGGEYKVQPQAALREASDLLTIAGSAPLQMQKSLPTPADADEAVKAVHERDLAWLDANDLLYQVNASRNYDPSAKLGGIAAPVLWMNSADDFINPPELGIAEREVKKMPHARFVLIPIGEQTHGHGSHSWAVLWQDRLAAFLRETQK
jgi:homoserine O-acetyltransferase